MELLLLLIGGFAFYLFFEHRDRALDRHPPIIVRARYPDVYDAVVKAIRTFSYEDYSWSISYADPDQGYIQARCRFREAVTSDLRAERRAIDLNVHIRETGEEETELVFSFDVMSAYGRVVAAQIIQFTEWALQRELQKVLDRRDAA